jgi:hypothetical protein
MDIGNAFKIHDGNYAYGKFDRSPYDPVLLTASFAPDRYIILQTQPNDFRDGAVGDNLSFELAASVFKALGANPDEHVFYASSDYISTGDPHGGSAGRISTGNLASYLLHGTDPLSEADMERALTDPYSLDVCGPDFSQVMSAYDYYWGGFNTITGGADGINGTDGWYYKDQFADPLPEGPYIAMNGAAGVETEEAASYRVSAGNMSKLATATLWFEVEDKFFEGKDFTGLNGFETIGGVQWTQNGEKWLGRATVGAMNGGVDIASPTDIFEMSYKAKTETGETAVTLTKVELSGYDENSNAVYIEAELVNDTVTTYVGQNFSAYDINLDLKVDQLDLTTAQKYYALGEGEAEWDEVAARADVDGNGSVGIEDFILILNNIVW